MVMFAEKVSQTSLQRVYSSTLTSVKVPTQLTNSQFAADSFALERLLSCIKERVHNDCTGRQWERNCLV